jgi:hypothetical protein
MVLLLHGLEDVLQLIESNVAKVAEDALSIPDLLTYPSVELSGSQAVTA